ncbi:hypothetical protein L9F63_019995, partial [Diploptera punctata]
QEEGKTIYCRNNVRREGKTSVSPPSHICKRVSYDELKSFPNSLAINVSREGKTSDSPLSHICKARCSRTPSQVTVSRTPSQVTNVTCFPNSLAGNQKKEKRYNAEKFPELPR